MSGPVVQFSVDGTTNVDQVTGRVKSSISNLEKSIEGIGKRFGSSFKDIFLSFLGPMALLGAAIGFISKIIDENAKKREDANQAAIDQTNKLMSAEDQYWANKRNNEKNSKEDAEQAKSQRKTTTLEFLNTDPRGRQIFQDYMNYKIGSKEPMYNNRNANAIIDPEVQAAVQKLIAEDMKNPAVAAGPVGNPFSAPSGFSNIVGVGANPVMEAMTSQLEEMRKQTNLLQQIASPTGTPIDFTKLNK